MDEDPRPRSLQEVSAETLALEEYLGSLSPGTLVTYVEIQQATGVPLSDSDDRGKLRSAARRLNIVYRTIRSVGIELSSEANAGSICRDGLRKMDRMARRQETVNKTLLEQHGAKMPRQERDHIAAVQAMFAQVKAIADGQKQSLHLAKAQKPKLAAPATVTPPQPK